MRGALFFRVERAFSFSFSLKIRYDNRKSDERPKPRMYYLGYENDALDFFLGDRRLCLCVVFLYDSSSKVVSRTHIARALLSHLSERV